MRTPVRAALPFPTAPGAMPLLGHLSQLVRAPLPFVRQLRLHGPVVRLRLAHRDVLAVTAPRLVRQILVDDQRRFDKGGPIADSMKATLGTNLVTCPADDHARQRALVNPGFHPSRMPAYSEAMRVAAVEVTDSWTPGQTLHLEHEAHRLAALAASRSLVSAPTAESAAAVLAEALPDISRGMYWRGMFGKAFSKLPLAVNRRHERQMARTRKAMDLVTAQYRNGQDHGDVLSRIAPACELEANPHQAIHDQVLTLLFGAVETTAAALVWILRLVSEHQITPRIHTELHEVLGSRPPCHEDIPQLAYTQRIITEALRLHPPAWLGTRKTTAPVSWPEGTIPPGTDVIFSPYALHRDPTVFADPDEFRPDRWTPENATSEQLRLHLAFGAGTRKCIGDTFAMNELTLALAVILSRWQLHHHPSSATQPTPRFILAPPPTPVTVQPRED
ncbi:cytochrome P450 [Streptomyces sp. NPDC048506]|uniref:cytochrome P450 n=1 Tax=Streptomyces sp. NPDC048506 TaxID=3155028 RepID=UPI003421A9AA